ncbi:hypothetical protein VP01_9215g1 [Puccinia sorghi]|uniref:DUF6818 domain-containing protein n=1 Tax=Puccinia sorghi TaxID=27349 RepID=A0A0L6U7W6_9BASI|nr:hypothetical protein VP01_9215g1 [Puccinia sorghi]
MVGWSYDTTHHLSQLSTEETRTPTRVTRLQRRGKIIKEILPTGSNEWERVHKLYSEYAIQNDQVTHDTEPLKTKFKWSFMSKKPTGDPSCQVWVCEAKMTNFLIKDRTHTLAFVDEEKGDDSTDERNGVSNPVTPV